MNFKLLCEIIDKGLKYGSVIDSVFMNICDPCVGSIAIPTNKRWDRRYDSFRKQKQRLG